MRKGVLFVFTHNHCGNHSLGQSDSEPDSGVTALGSPNANSPAAELTDLDDLDHRGALGVAAGQIDPGGDAPVVVAGRIVQDLPDGPDAVPGRRVPDCSSMINSAGPLAAAPVCRLACSAK